MRAGRRYEDSPMRSHVLSFAMVNLWMFEDCAVMEGEAGTGAGAIVISEEEAPFMWIDWCG